MEFVIPWHDICPWTNLIAVVQKSKNWVAPFLYRSHNIEGIIRKLKNTGNALTFIFLTLPLTCAIYAALHQEMRLNWFEKGLQSIKQYYNSASILSIIDKNIIAVLETPFISHIVSRKGFRLIAGCFDNFPEIPQSNFVMINHPTQWQQCRQLKT